MPRTTNRPIRLPHWTTVAPPVGLVALALTWGRALPLPLVLLMALVLGTAVLAAVHHAEVVAHRVGEPFGSLILAVAVTVIEVALVVTLMAGGKPGAETLARDTVFAAVMITTNGIVGLALLAASRRHDFAAFNSEGAGAALACVLTLAVLSLVVPTYTTTPGPQFSPAQLAFAAFASLGVYLLFITTQAGRHRDFFLPVGSNGDPVDDDSHATPPSNRAAWSSLGLLFVALVAVVGLAKVCSPALESAVDAAGLPHSFVGVIIAILVLAPESIAAVNAARRDRTQTSLNLAYGSALASIGLTIPALALANVWMGAPLHLGLGPLHLTLLAVTAIVSVLTVVPGRATRLQGGLHLVLAAAYVFLAANP